jgi:hypothetical protein
MGPSLARGCSSFKYAYAQEAEVEAQEAIDPVAAAEAQAP